MAKIQEARPIAVKQKIYSVIELQAFDAEIKAKYRVEKTLSNGEKITVTDYKQMHRDYKTVRLSADPRYEDPIIVYQTESGEFITPTKYQELQDKITQYQNWMRGKEFGESMRLKDLDKVAKKMEVPAVVIQEE